MLREAFVKLGKLSIFDNVVYRVGIIALVLTLATTIPALTQVPRAIYACIFVLAAANTIGKVFIK